LVRCKQTLNLTNGGKGNANFETIDASRTVSWLRFQDELQEYIKCRETSLVPQSYVNHVSEYKLGNALSNVRQGQLWRGHPDETKRVEWLESLPCWAWNAIKTDEWRNAVSERGKKQWADADEETRAEWRRKLSEGQNRPEVKAAASERAKKQFESQEARDALSEIGKKQWADADEETRAEWCRKISEARNRPEAKVAQSEHSTTMWANADRETRTEWCRKMSEAHSTPEAKEAQSKRSKAQIVRWAAEGKPSLADRGKSTSTSNWTKEQRDTAIAKQVATNAANRANVLANLPESERPQKQAEFDRNDRKEAARKSRAIALQSLETYADKDHQWCYRNQAQAKKEGVVFFQDASGVWCARMGDKGKGSSV
jgi:hypothetical protein